MTFPIRLLAVVIALILAASVSAKGVTVKIVIRGGDLSAPLIITDEDIVSRFNIWSGPNSRWRSKDGAWQSDYSGIFIDFPAGMANDRPSGLIQFDVEFYLAESRIGGYMDESYDVRYAMNTSTPGGYFYLPIGNPYIYHGVEGNWLRSTNSWEELVRPMIQSKLDSSD